LLFFEGSGNLDIKPVPERKKMPGFAANHHLSNIGGIDQPGLLRAIVKKKYKLILGVGLYPERLHNSKGVPYRFPSSFPACEKRALIAIFKIIA